MTGFFVAKKLVPCPFNCYHCGGLEPTIVREVSAGKPILGICVGLQILFAGNEESLNVDGLKIFGGHVLKNFFDA